MMADPLEGCRAKIERAKEHFLDLNAEIETFASLNPYGVSVYDDAQTGERIWLAKVTAQPPIRWGVIVGEIAHQLRSALDHLAWQLVLDGGGKPETRPGGTEFPIFWKGADKFETSGRRRLKGASERAVGFIESLQPYQRRDRFWEHPLYILHELDARDKHRVLNLGVGGFERATVTYTSPTDPVGVRQFEIGGSEPISPLVDGTEIYRHPVEDRASEMRMQGQLIFRLVFEQGGPAEGEQLTETLGELIDFVDRLITLFRPMFRHGPS